MGTANSMEFILKFEKTFHTDVYRDNQYNSSFIPLYFYGCPKNFAGMEPNYVLCALVTLYVSMQALILLAQHSFILELLHSN